MKFISFSFVGTTTFFRGEREGGTVSNGKRKGIIRKGFNVISILKFVQKTEKFVSENLKNLLMENKNAIFAADNS